MKLFGRTGGYYLFWAGFIYLAAVIINIQYQFADSALLSLAWVVSLLIPLTIKPVADYFNMSTFWAMITPRKLMSDYNDNVYNLPKPKLVPPVPEVGPTKDEVSKIFYRFGVTDNNRVAFSMGYNEITLNKQGCQQMIDQLTFFMNQLEEEELE